MKEILDIPFREVDGMTLYIDLFLPDNAENLPLIFWTHGGAWKMGDRKWCGLKDQLERGYAVASVDYRLTTVAPFPAQIEDCKYALAFLRKNADRYPVDFSRVCAAGNSSGGQLAAMMGATIGHADWELEGTDCSVQAVIDLYGQSWLKRKYPLDPEQDNSVVNALLGIDVTSKKGIMLAAAASPITYIDGTEPPFLILHGDNDDIVFIEQSLMLHDELKKYGCNVTMHTVSGAGHGFEHTPEINAVINEFLDCHFMKGN